MSTALATDVVELTRQLVRFDTTNPPGNEAACLKYLADLLTDAGLDCRLIGAHADRPNLIARLPGRGSAPPLLLHGHLDVVPVAGQRWSRPPFGAELVEGCVWGRGTIDMKGGVAMMVSALLRLIAAGEQPAATVLLALVSDEEAGSHTGAEYLVQEHPHLFDGVRYAIGEDGGASIGIGGRRLHPIVVAEKRACWVRVTFRGPGGHASRVAPDANPVRQLNRLLTAVAGGGLGGQPTTAVRRMLAELGVAAAPELATIYRAVAADPSDLSPLAGLPERDRLYLRSVLQHSVNATVLRGGTNVNVLPTEVSVDLDGRLLPGPAGSQDFIAAVRALVPDDLEVELLVEGEPLPEPEFGPMYELLADVLRQADPDGVPVPMIMTASTDARLFPQLGISCYGWLPMLFRGGVNYRDLMHSAEERVPVEALQFGESCFYDLVRRYG
ncbi:M20/M25/M40 family metallo-hydrolase [Jatrophihabitans sp.]|jgi:acetylornithine deacetylase/succinyl-diaminopimelate desuccinylase-like protein|uniref:M20/M25/M40 family metallo-hydrolase n=1 Tax=Jatrophihabitans sp. TaxID=1932789 RepID=UPI002F23CF29